MLWSSVLGKAQGAAAPEGLSATEVGKLSGALMSVTARNVANWGDGRAIVHRYCEAIVQATDRVPLAWCWFGARNTDMVQPQVVAGRARQWADQLRIRRTWLTRLGPAFRALDGHASEPFDVSRFALWGPWRRAAAEHGIRSVLCVPLASPQEDQCGVFIVYADGPEFFEATREVFASLGSMFGALLSQSRRSAALEVAAHTDALTGLGNRHALSAVMDALRSHHGAPESITFIVADIDHFKRINDEFGHSAGDAALREVARRLREAVRQSDVVLRLGGEEFLVVLRRTSLEQGLSVAEGARAMISSLPVELSSANAVPLTCSFGVAACPPSGNFDDTLAAADAALYRAKAAGRNRVEPARPPAPVVRTSGFERSRPMPLACLAPEPSPDSMRS